MKKVILVLCSIIILLFGCVGQSMHESKLISEFKASVVSLNEDCKKEYEGKCATVRGIDDMGDKFKENLHVRLDFLDRPDIGQIVNVKVEKKYIFTNKIPSEKLVLLGVYTNKKIVW